MTIADLWGQWQDAVLADGGKVEGKSLRNRCPACQIDGAKHSGRSLKIDPAGDRILVHCKAAACKGPDLAEYYGLPLSTGNGTGRAAQYEYSPTAVKVRKPGKRIHWAVCETEPGLYHAAEVRTAAREGRDILLCEGEDDADAARERGHVATTLPHGASSPWRDEYTQDLATTGTVTISAHRDPEGREYARNAGRALTGHVGRVRVVQARSGNDLRDHLDAGYDLADLEPVKAAPIDVELADRPTFAVRVFDLADPTPAPPPSWILPGWICDGDYVVIGGERKAGKSLLALHTAMALATGKPWVGGDTAVKGPCRVEYVDEENPRGLVDTRRWALARGHGIDIGELVNVRYLHRSGIRLDQPDARDALLRDVDTFGPRLVVLDSLIRLHGGEENDNTAMAGFYDHGIRPIVERGVAVLLLAHLKKPTRGTVLDLNRVRGASEILAPADGIWLYEERRDRSPLLRFDRGRWGEDPDPIEVELVTEDGTSRLVGRAPATATDPDRLPFMAQRILDFLKGCKTEGAGCTQIGSQVGRSRNVVRDWIQRELLPRRLVEPHGQGYRAIYGLELFGSAGEGGEDGDI